MRIATRGSSLARWQAQRVASLLTAAHPGLAVELVVVSTQGDRNQEVPVWELGGQGVFVKEVQAAVLDGRADLAVHSAKDLPSTATPGLVLAAFPERADPRDSLVGAALGDLAPGAPLATGSVRRRAQLAAVRPDLTFSSVRGNIATRLERIPAGGALVVAHAALVRLGLEGRAAEILEPSVVLPQVGQGALATECRDGDQRSLDLLAAVDDPVVRAGVTAERAVLAALGGGCDVPAGAHAVVVADDGVVAIDGLVAGLDGGVVIRDRRSGPVASGEELGADLGASLAARAGAAGLAGVLRGPG